MSKLCKYGIDKLPKSILNIFIIQGFSKYEKGGITIKQKLLRFSFSAKYLKDNPFLDLSQ
jgi:hypothetical protein